MAHARSKSCRNPIEILCRNPIIVVYFPFPWSSVNLKLTLYQFVMFINVTSFAEICNRKALSIWDKFTTIQNRFICYFYKCDCSKTCFTQPTTNLTEIWCIRINKNTTYSTVEAGEQAELLYSFTKDC